MRLNKFIAQATGLSRRGADHAITNLRVEVNNKTARIGQNVFESDKITIDGRHIKNEKDLVTIILNKPVGCVCSRKGQGSKTIYDLLPKEMFNLKPVGRLDKDTSGLILLTNNGELANKLTHPRFQKVKIYEVELDKPVQKPHLKKIAKDGVALEDGISKLEIKKIDDLGKKLKVAMREGRNRQIRRTFEAMDYEVVNLHRIKFGDYELAGLLEKSWRISSAS